MQAQCTGDPKPKRTITVVAATFKFKVKGTSAGNADANAALVAAADQAGTAHIFTGPVVHQNADDFAKRQTIVDGGTTLSPSQVGYTWKAGQMGANPARGVKYKADGTVDYYWTEFTIVSRVKTEELFTQGGTNERASGTTHSTAQIDDAFDNGNDLIPDPPP